MSNKAEKLCRLCLRASIDDFGVIEDVTKYMLNTISLKIDFSISKDPLICNKCSEDLEKSFDFKSNFVSGITHDVNESLGNNIDYVFCQFCKKYIKKFKCTTLDKLRQDGSLAKYIPEMDPDISLACIPCLVSLENCIRFFSNCRNVEEKINTFYGVQDINNGQVELSDLVELVSKDMSKSKLGLQGTDGIIKNESFTQENDQENSIKLEDQEVIIKTEADNLEKMICESTPGFKMLYYCDNCTYEVKQEPDLQCHSLTHKCDNIKTDPQVTIYICDECPYESNLKFNLKQHMLAHDTPLFDIPKNSLEGTHYACDKCNFTTKQISHLRFHKLTHIHTLKVPMFKCESCDYQTRQLPDIRSHARSHSRRVKCIDCGLEINLSNLVAHMLTHARFRCHLCNFTAKEKKQLMSHMSIHDRKGNKTLCKTPKTTPIHRCHLCPAEIKCRSSFMRHMLTHKNPSELGMHKCEWCSYKAKRLGQIKAHLLKHKNRSEIKLYKCSVCDNEFKMKNSLKKHMSKHENCEPKV